MKIGEFFVHLGIKSDLGKAKDFAKLIGNLPVEAIAAITAIGGIEYSLFRLSQQMVNTATKFNIFEAATGLSAQELQKWQLVAERVGVNTDTVASNIQQIQRNLTALPYNPSMARPFGFLGINPIGKNAFQVLNELAEIMPKMDRAKFSMFANQIGVSDEMLRVLALSKRQRDEFMGNVPGMTPRMARDFESLREKLTGFSQNLRQIGMVILSDMVRPIEKLVDIFSKELPQAMQITEKALDNIIKILPYLVKFIGMELQGWGYILEGINNAMDSAKDKLNSTGNKFGSSKPFFPKIKAFGDWLDSNFLPQNFQPASASTAAPANVNINFHGITDSKENLIREALKASQYELGISTRVQINNNVTKR